MVRACATLGNGVCPERGIVRKGASNYHSGPNLPLHKRQCLLPAWQKHVYLSRQCIHPTLRVKTTALVQQAQTPVLIVPLSIRQTQSPPLPQWQSTTSTRTWPRPSARSLSRTSMVSRQRRQVPGILTRRPHLIQASSRPDLSRPAPAEAELPLVCARATRPGAEVVRDKMADLQTDYEGEGY